MKPCRLVVILCVVASGAAFARADDPAQANEDVPVTSRDEDAQSRRVDLDKPVKISATTPDKTRLAGEVVWYDADGFELRDAQDADQTQFVYWSDLGGKGAFQVYSRLIGDKAPAERWVDLGAALWALEPDGKEWAEKAFARATKLDPKAKERVDAVKDPRPAEGDDDDGAEAGDGEDGGKLVFDPGEPERDKQRNKRKPRQDEPDDDEDDDGELMKGAGEEVDDHDGPAGKEDGDGPKQIGRTEAKFWGKLDDAAMTESVDTLKAFGAQTQDKINRNLKLHETRFFLFYSDLDAGEAKEWAGLLDKMYARLCELFGVAKGTNVWRGKALIVVFREETDYAVFQDQMHDTPARGTAGMCHSFGDGHVHIAFYRQQDRMKFAHVLVHESVHGFLHRYRSPVHVPSWANEGLAEVIAGELVPKAGRINTIRQHARNEIQRNGGLRRSFFTNRQISAWQYPVAEALCNLMIRENKRGYVNFINGVKDGMEWEQSLKKHFGTDSDRLAEGLSQDLGVRGVR
ncbi:MAG: hypothetical protein ACREIT_08325 [Tepidisphaeraceae bacterium]